MKTGSEEYKRKKYIRNKAIIVTELIKGFTTIPTDNAMLTLIEFTNYILELTTDVE